MVPTTAPLIGFSGEIIWPLGENITDGKDWRRGTFNLGLDEFCDKEGQNKLCNLLRHNLDVFSWKPADMTGVPRHIAEHRLNVREGCPLVRQKKRGQATYRNQAIQEEVKKLVDVDFKDLNKACHKDGYLLPEIDWKVESLTDFLLNAF
ncbi:hypothetical protein Tco_1196243 [Tanacetum coccineum]